MNEDRLFIFLLKKQTVFNNLNMSNFFTLRVIAIKSLK